MKLGKSPAAREAEIEKKTLDRELAADRNMIFFHGTVLCVFLFIILREALCKPVLEWNAWIWASVGMFLVVAFDVIYFVYAWFQKRQKIELEPSWDAVTGVWSAVYFENRLQEELTRAGRYRYPVTLGVVDIENFRSFNENFGPKRGDELLRQFATTLQGNIRSVDLLARAGDDTFFLLLPHTDVVRAERVVQRLLELAGQELNVQFRAGLTTFRVGENALQLQMRAKAALENARREGSKRIQCLISDGENYTAIEF